MMSDTQNAFAYFDLTPAFELDLSELERRYFARQRQVHPDRFATKSPEEKSNAANQAAEANKAYETLKDPLLRSEHLLELQGFKAQDTVHDPVLLVEMMERREILSGVKNPQEIDDLITASDQDIVLCEKSLADSFSPMNYEKALAEVNRLKYLIKFKEEAVRSKLLTKGKEHAPSAR